jgi:diguanylate cyclase
MLAITGLLTLLNRNGLREKMFVVRARTHVVLGNVMFTGVVGFSGVFTGQDFFEKDVLIVLGVNLVATVIMVMIYEILYRDMRARKVLKVTAETDFLTGLSNRRTIDQYLNKEFQHCRDSSDDLSLAILDIDHFKQINDTYGHEIGDQVLKRVATMIRDHVRSTDFVGRYGGEEFVIIFPHLGKDVAVEIADRVRRMIERTPIKINEDCTVSVTVSIGVSTLAEETEKTLHSTADERLYVAKKTGRNRTVSKGMRECVEVI